MSKTADLIATLFSQSLVTLPNELSAEEIAEMLKGFYGLETTKGQVLSVLTEEGYTEDNGKYRKAS
jgi:DNA-binding transcriptional regulator PaaX